MSRGQGDNRLQHRMITETPKLNVWREGWSPLATRGKKVDKMYYYVVLYKKDRKIPIPFNSWERADNFIHYFKLHAYITI